MGTKIIAVNAAIVLIVGLLSFFLMRSAVVSAASDVPTMLAEAKHDASGASARLELDALRVERWLSAKAATPAAREPLDKADPAASGDAATALCDRIVADAKTSDVFQGGSPSLVVLVDAAGKVRGRNGSNLLRGDDLGAAYPGFREALTKGQAGSDVWVSKARSDSYLASYAPVRDETGRVVGALAVGIPLTDELSRVADAVTGRPLLLASPGQGGAMEVLLRSTSDTGSLDAAVAGEAKDTVKSAFDSRSVSAAKAGDIIVAAASLEALGSGKSAVLVVGAPLTLFPGAGTLPLPILGVMLLGIVLVVVGGVLLGGYIMRPISTLEEGLLAVLNGQTDRRIELEHAELGGLAFRINQLLNQFMGIEEDTTDDEGRVSRAPNAASFASMEVSEQVDPATAAALAQEPAAQYYARIYREYIGAKRALGEPVDHVTEQAFVSRVQSMEQEAAQKQGRPVRFQIQTRGNEVVFQPVALG
jgi:hypothetical protein